MKKKKVIITILIILFILLIAYVICNIFKEEKTEFSREMHVDFAPVSLEELKTNSTNVIRVKAIKKLKENKEYTTDYKVEVLEELKGKVSSKHIKIVLYGNKEVTSPDVPVLEEGKEYIVFLKKINEKRYSISSWKEGIFSFENGMYANQCKTKVVTIQKLKEGL